METQNLIFPDPPKCMTKQGPGTARSPDHKIIDLGGLFSEKQAACCFSSVIMANWVSIP